MVSFDKLTNLLKGADITPSVQRIKVLEYLFNCKIHPTADRIYKALKDQSAGISLATVYNTLKLFEEKKLIRVLALEGMETCYDIMLHDHGHFICTKCGSITNFDIRDECTIKIENDSLSDYKINQRDVYFKGICPKCL